MSTADAAVSGAPAPKETPTVDAVAKAPAAKKAALKKSVSMPVAKAATVDAAAKGLKKSGSKDKLEKKGSGNKLAEADQAGGKADAAPKALAARKPGRRPSVIEAADGASPKDLKKSGTKDKLAEADTAGGKGTAKAKGKGDEADTEGGKGKGKGKATRRSTWTGPDVAADAAGVDAAGVDAAGGERKSSKEKPSEKAGDKAAGGKKVTIAGDTREPPADSAASPKPWWMFGCCSVALRTPESKTLIEAVPVATPVSAVKGK